MKTYKNLVFVLVTVLAILIQLTNPMLAYADDGAPTQPVDSATEVAPPQEPVATEPPVISAIEAAPTEEAVATEAATEVAPPQEPVATEPPVTPMTEVVPTEEAVATEAATAEAVPTPTETATKAAPTELPVATEVPTVEPVPDDNSDPSAVPPVIDEPTVTEVVQQISADTDVVVVDETGEVVPLATQEAAEIIASSDPVWCPAGKKPGDAGCSSSLGSLSALVAGFVPTGNGTIWIQNVPDTGSAVVIDGYDNGNWSSAAGYRLTLQGGWNGTFDSTGVITSTNSTFNVPISILYWDNNITVNNLNVQNVSGTGLDIYTSGNVTVNNSNFVGNQIGMSVTFNNYTSDQLQGFNVNNSTLENNDLGLFEFISCTGGVTGTGANSFSYINNRQDFQGLVLGCPWSPTPPTPAVTQTPISQSPGEFSLSCAHQSLYNVTLPNDDRVQIFCPVSGKALIKRLDNTMLPADLPAGYTYASAFSLDIFQGQGPLPVITEGGNIKASFHLASLEAGTSYSILYWDNGTWIPLKEFILDENGKPRSFELSPGDPRVILSGLNFDFSGASPRVEVSTNFPGVFVLAQY